MWKAIKLVVGMLILSGLGYIYGQYNRTLQEAKEEKYYSYISFALPNSDASMVQIKRTPKSQCEKWRIDYFTATSEQCVGCTLLANECRKDISQDYHDAFDQKATRYSYIYKPYRYPEIIVFRGLPEGAFSQLCALSKESLKTTMCFE